MYRIPSSLQRKNKEEPKLNLIPILDSVFIFIFFLLVSTSFIHLKEITSDVPIISESEPLKNEKPLALTLQISKNEIKVLTGLESTLVKKLPFNPETMNELQKTIAQIKNENPKEKTIILEPQEDISYEKIVLIMDTVRQSPDQEELFTNIVFSNVME